MRHLYIRAILCDVDPGTKIGDAIVAGIAIATRNGAPVTFALGNVAVTVLPNMA